MVGGEESFLLAPQQGVTSKRNKNLIASRLERKHQSSQKCLEDRSEVATLITLKIFKLLLRHLSHRSLLGVTPVLFCLQGLNILVCCSCVHAPLPHPASGMLPSSSPPYPHPVTPPACFLKDYSPFSPSLPFASPFKTPLSKINRSSFLKNTPWKTREGKNINAYSFTLFLSSTHKLVEESQSHSMVSSLGKRENQHLSSRFSLVSTITRGKSRKPHTKINVCETNL